MSRSTLNMRAIAEHLVAYEAKEKNPSETNVPAAFGGVVERLRRSLVSLTGGAGFRSLLSRALALASGEVRWLRAVTIQADGSLGCPDLTQMDEKEIARGELAVLAQLLGLLVTFIGGSLTLRLVQDEWPEALMDNLVLSKEEYEKTK